MKNAVASDWLHIHTYQVAPQEPGLCHIAGILLPAGRTRLLQFCHLLELEGHFDGVRLSSTVKTQLRVYTLSPDPFDNLKSVI